MIAHLLALVCPSSSTMFAGQIKFMIGKVNAIMAFVRDKHVNMLAVTTPKRMSLFPDVPPLAESGITLDVV